MGTGRFLLFYVVFASVGPGFSLETHSARLFLVTLSIFPFTFS